MHANNFQILISLFRIFAYINQGANGAKAYVGQFPYQIDLVVDHPPAALRHQCGGAIISRRTVLTAAHCLNRDLDESIYLIYAATLVTPFETSHTFLTHVESLTIHPDYNEQTLDGDIALINVTLQFPWYRTQIAALPLASEAPKDGTKCVATGWGTTEKGVLSVYLLYAKVEIYNFVKCLANCNLTKRMICAIGPGGGRGDSGGPLKCNGQLAGVVSIGHDARVDEPVVSAYADVSAYRTWIDLNMYKEVIISRSSAGLRKCSLVVLIGGIFLVK